MFKHIVKDEGMAFDNASQRLNREGIACTPMTILKFIIKKMRVLHNDYKRQCGYCKHTSEY